MISANDEFFAPKEALLKASRPEWREGEYTERGKWMDGWETRRRRTPGHDWAIVRLGLPGIVRGVVIDTSFFTGNYPPRASLDACASVEDDRRLETLMASKTVRGGRCSRGRRLKGDTRQRVRGRVTNRRVTHLRLNIFPDGGVARLRVHGVVVPDERDLRCADARSISPR